MFLTGLNMSKIVTVCSVHGELRADQAYMIKQKNKNKKGLAVFSGYRCKQCKMQHTAINYWLDPESQREYARKLYKESKNKK